MRYLIAAHTDVGIKKKTNQDSYMIKEREVKEKEIKEKIYNDECEKIDKMVSNKIITKEKGEKLKQAITNSKGE